MIQIQINRTTDKPIYIQIREAIKQAVSEKKLLPGEKLPAISTLAADLDVTQATILRAFEDLSKEKIIVSHVGRGTFINDTTGEAVLAVPKTGYPGFSMDTRDSEFLMAARRLRMGIADSLDALQILAKKPGIIHLTAGIPDPEIADPGILTRASGKALMHGEKNYLGYSDTLGLPALRDAIAARYNRKGLDISRENVLITSGSQQAISVLAQVALEKNYRVICESPCYQGITMAFGAIGHWVEPVMRDAAGPLPEKFKRFDDDRPSLLYLCPKLHNPMGTDLDEERTAMIAHWAGRSRSLIIAHEIFEDLYFDAAPRPSYFEKLGKEQTVVIGSISKSFMCGMRIGWLLAGADKIRSYAPLKRAIDLGCPPLMQAIALAVFESGEYDLHIKKAREHYKVRSDAALAALEKYMPGSVHWTKPAGSMHMWVELPAGYSSIALFLLAIERGVEIKPGPMLDMDHRFINGFKLSYGSVMPAQIDEAIGLLAEAVHTLLKNPPGDAGLSGLGDFI